MHVSPKLFWTILPLPVGLATPSAVIWWLELFVAHTSLASAIVDLAQRQFAKGENLFWLALFGLIPFALLSVISLIAARFVSRRRLACISAGGLVGILAFMVPAHASVWYPLYGGGHISSTAAIAFIFIPFYCIATLLIGLLVGLAISFFPFLRHKASATLR
jgi:hypothetical protein